jgi:hypothetical protein
MLTVPEMLEEAAKTYRERNALYGNNYKEFGRAMRALFPNGVSFSNYHDHNRFALMVMIVSKISRYAAQFSEGGHDDSLLDLSVYAQMLRELDGEMKELVGSIPLQDADDPGMPYSPPDSTLPLPADMEDFA